MKKYNEAILKTELVELIELNFPRNVTFKHQDVFTHGVPDLSINGNPNAWIECKYADPIFESRDVQHRKMIQLARATNAFYVVWYYKRNPAGFSTRLTFIVPPDQLVDGAIQENWNNFSEDFNHPFIIRHLKGLRKK